MSYSVYKMNETASITFEILYVTHSEYDKGWHSTSHTHHFTELFYILKGQGSFVLKNREVHVKENDLVVINPNIEHTEKSDIDNSLEYIALGIQGISFSIPKEEGLEIGLFTYQDDRNQILFYLNKLLKEVAESEEYYEVICKSIIEILIAKLKRAKKVTVNAHESKKMNQSVAQAKYYIQQNYKEDITLETLAEVGNINKFYLAHKFKEDIGVSPIGYLNQIRIQSAKTLLETTNYTIAEISSFCGFSSQSFFSQAFRRELQQSPSAYRRKKRELEKR